MGLEKEVNIYLATEVNHLFYTTGNKWLPDIALPHFVLFPELEFSKFINKELRQKYLGPDDSETHPLPFICAHELAHNLNNDVIYQALSESISRIAITILMQQALLYTLAPQNLLTKTDY